MKQNKQLTPQFLFLTEKSGKVKSFRLIYVHEIKHGHFIHHFHMAYWQPSWGILPGNLPSKYCRMRNETACCNEAFVSVVFMCVCEKSDLSCPLSTTLFSSLKICSAKYILCQMCLLCGIFFFQKYMRQVEQVVLLKFGRSSWYLSSQLLFSLVSLQAS